MSKQMKANRVINGTFGRLWWDEDLLANTKSFEAKATLNWETVNISEDLADHQKYMGWSGAGTITLHKIDSLAAVKLADAIQNGDMPDFKLVSRLADPAAYGHERVELTGVTFDELTLIKWANKEVGEEELPFKFSGYRFLDKIE
nr:MAG TPA: tail tube protein [Caudoviricetes sp.]